MGGSNYDTNITPHTLPCKNVPMTLMKFYGYLASYLSHDNVEK